MHFDKCVKSLLNNDICVLPSETVYGLAGSALSTEAIKKIYRLKGRPKNNPLIVHVLDHQSAKSICYTNNISSALALVFWPGALTFILPKKDCIPDIVTAGLKSVAIRSPSHALFRSVLKKTNIPLAAPSANPSNKLSPTNASDVINEFGVDCPLVLDGGSCKYGIESTVLDLTNPIPKILRLGPITKLDIENVIQTEVKDVNIYELPINDGSKPISSPGQMAKHYAPKTPIRLFLQVDEFLKFNFEQNSDIIILSHPLSLSKQWQKGFSVLYFSEGGRPEDVARNLFKVLRDADNLNKKYINLILFPQNKKEYSAINDRILRASTIRI